MPNDPISNPAAELIAFWATFIADVNDPPAPSISAAVDSLQLVATTVTDQEGEDFFNAVVQLYFDIGLINQNTYTQMRNEINQAGEAKSVTVFDTIFGKVQSAPETQVVLAALSSAVRLDEIDQIPLDIITIETDRDLQSDQVLIDAYNAGIAALEERKLRLEASNP